MAIQTATATAASLNLVVLFNIVPLPLVARSRKNRFEDWAAIIVSSVMQAKSVHRIDLVAIAFARHQPLMESS